MSIITNKKWVFLICMTALFPFHMVWGWDSSVRSSMTPEAIQNRIKPVGSVDVEGGVAQAVKAAPQALGPDAGKKRYESSCSVCHQAGIAGAPRFRNKADWASRQATGLDAMLASAIKGKGQMPPKGTCMSCSDEELRMAIKYMLPQ